MATTKDDDDARPDVRGEDAARTSGQIFAEIAQLTERTRATRDRTIERRILRLRHEAGVRMQREHERLVDLPTPDLDGLPTKPGIAEVERERVTPSLLRAAILRDGCLIARGLVERDDALRLAREIDRAFEERERKDAGGEAAPGYYEPFRFVAPYKSPARRWIKAGGGLLAADSPALAFDLLETFDRAGISGLAQGYLGPFVLSAEKTTLRKVPPTAVGAWHQDGAFMGDVRSLNIWLALSHCGDDAPGLDIVPCRLDTLVPTGTEGAYLPDQVSPAEIEEAAGGRDIVRPVFEPGDAVLFDDLCLHQTAADPSMPNTRFAIESWFFAAAGLAADYAPIAVTRP